MADGNTLSSLWKTTAGNHGNRPFLIFRHKNAGLPDAQWTYGEFDGLVARTAARLQDMGVGHGDAVHICLANCPAFVMVWLAVARLGAWMVPVDPGSTRRDIRNQISRTAPKLGVCAKERADVYRQGADGLLSAIVEVDETAADTHAGSPLLGESVFGAQAENIGAHDRLAIMFTSGTTSEPKGVELTQANYHYTATTMAGLVGQTERDRWYVCLPLFHGNAQYYCFLAAMAAGASVALAAAFTASGWPFHADELKATHASLFAAPIRMILARRQGNAPALRLKHVWFAQSLAPGHFREFTAMCGVVPRQLYGMTETTAVATASTGPNPTCDSIGAVVPGREIALLDPMDHTPVPDGTPGIITLAGRRGIDLFSGYLDNDAATQRAFPSALQTGKDWFITGDLAVRDAQGEYRFVGRVDDVIKVSGENVSLTEVESAIAQAPGVLEAAVLAIDDPVRDKVPIAYVVARSHDAPPTPEGLAQWAEQNLTPAARPRQWHLIDELPRTSVGKIRRFKLAKPT